MPHSSSGWEDDDGTLDRREGGGRLKITDSGIYPPISVIVYRETDGDGLDGRWFCEWHDDTEQFGWEAIFLFI